MDTNQAKRIGQYGDLVVIMVVLLVFLCDVIYLVVSK